MNIIEAIEEALKSTRFQKEFVYIRERSWGLSWYYRIPRNVSKRTNVICITRDETIRHTITPTTASLLSTNWEVADKDPIASDES